MTQLWPQLCPEPHALSCSCNRWTSAAAMWVLPRCASWASAALPWSSCGWAAQSRMRRLAGGLLATCCPVGAAACLIAPLHSHWMHKGSLLSPRLSPSSPSHCRAPTRRGLRDILPALEQRQQAPAADSWDALLDVDDAAQLAAAVAGGGRLMQLQCLHWTNIPYRVAEHCRETCPKVAINPSGEDVARRRLPASCDPTVELDAPLLAGGVLGGRGVGRHSTNQEQL